MKNFGIDSTNSPRAFVRAASFLLSILFCCSAALAQEETHPELAKKSIEDLMEVEVESVYSASRYMQKVTDAPSSVTIVTSDQIQRYGYRTLNEILRSVRGFYGSNDRNYSYVGVRGFARPGDYNTRVLLLINGHRINDNVYDQALVGLELPIDIDLIERVEVIRGPSSSLYGTNAFFAVINVITKRGRDSNGLEVSGEVASFGTYKGRVTYGKTYANGSDLLLSGSYYDSRGPSQLFFREFDDPATNNGIAQSVDDESQGSIFGVATLKGFTVRGVFGRREKGIPTGAFGTFFNDRRNRTIDDRGYIDLQYAHTFASQLHLTARVSYDSYHYEGTYIFDFSSGATPELATNKDYFQAEWWTGEVQLTRTIARKHKLTFGTEYRDNLRQDQQNFDLESSFVYIEDRRKSKNFALYLQDDFAIRDNLTFNAGVRFDYHTNFGGTARPRFALIYKPTPKGALKFLYGEAFRNPNNYELYYGSGVAFITNPSLKPETIRTEEVVWEQYLGNHLRLSASAYRYVLKGLITQVTHPVENKITFVNAEEVRAKGFELELESRLANGLEIRAAYTGQSTRDQATGQVLTNSPAHLGKFNFAAPLFSKKVFANFELHYTSRRRTLNNTELNSSWAPNLTFVGKGLVRNLDMSLSFYNLFDRRYADPGSEEHRQHAIEQNGRHVRAKFTYRF